MSLFGEGQELSCLYYETLHLCMTLFRRKFTPDAGFQLLILPVLFEPETRFSPSLLNCPLYL